VSNHHESVAPLVQAEALHKAYRHRGVVVAALRGVDLAIYPGEFVAIIGPSGCGKSTLVNLLGGLDEPTSGTVYFAGQRISALGEGARALLRRRRIGFVFQAYDLLPLLTVAQNIEFPLAVAGVSPAAAHACALDLLAQVGLADKAEAMPDDLSGGQQQRVAIARTLAIEPDVVFADEPTGSLDTLTGGDIIALLRGAVSARGMTLVMVTHDAEDAAKADRIVRLLDGRVVEETPV
jgi:putative ABC transport system ATP-binding protein